MPPIVSSGVVERETQRASDRNVCVCVCEREREREK